MEDFEINQPAALDKLNTVRRHPKSGSTKSLVVLLHGIGDSGAGLISFADVFGDELPDTMFVAADAPFSCPHVPFGYQWFDLLGAAEASPADALREITHSTRLLLSMIAQETAAANLDAGKVVVFGFSQGAMLALNAVPRMLEPVAGLVACSGGFMEFAPMDVIALVKPPVLVLHGDNDQIVPFSLFDNTVEELQNSGFDVQSHVMQGGGHEISDDGINVIGEFLLERIGGL